MPCKLETIGNLLEKMSLLTFANCVLCDNTGKKSCFTPWRTVLKKGDKIASLTFLPVWQHGRNCSRAGCMTGKRPSLLLINTYWKKECDGSLRMNLNSVKGMASGFIWPRKVVKI